MVSSFSISVTNSERKKFAELIKLKCYQNYMHWFQWSTCIYRPARATIHWLVDLYNIHVTTLKFISFDTADYPVLHLTVSNIHALHK